MANSADEARNAAADARAKKLETDAEVKRLSDKVRTNSCMWRQVDKDEPRSPECCTSFPKTLTELTVAGLKQSVLLKLGGRLPSVT